MMKKEGLNLGGEQSGHVIFLDQSTTGDGIVAALKVLEVMQRTGLKLSELKKQIRLFPQCLENIRVKKKPPLEKLPSVQEQIQKIQKKLNAKGRVFVRYSGTEPLARVMVEGENLDQVKTYTRSLATLIQKELG